ncbi:hypothetical protein SAMN04488515_3205 [Cognatiyoonia koreensis]|uniref:Uncharacterized protein n=1 Tax=Cognatiyoonia koreensis TaxID=364200 RepID=A0A1I0RUM9_9RHOB|nr:hypothetical protein SAMN04488515_3205 [Cognatiyoonia koreensis]
MFRLWDVGKGPDHAANEQGSDNLATKSAAFSNEILFKDI